MSNFPVNLHSGCQMFHKVQLAATNSCSERRKGYSWLCSMSADMVCHIGLPRILLLYRTIQMVCSESFEASDHSAGSGTAISLRENASWKALLSPQLPKRWFFIILGVNSPRTALAIHFTKSELQNNWFLSQSWRDQNDCKKLELMFIGQINFYLW